MLHNKLNKDIKEKMSLNKEGFPIRSEKEQPPVVAPWFDHASALQESGYFAAYEKFSASFAETRKRLSLLVKVKDGVGQGLFFGNRLNEPEVRERIVRESNRFRSAIKERNTREVYRAVVNIHGLKIGGSHYPREGITMNAHISPSDHYRKVLDGCRELISRFKSTIDPVEPSSDIVWGSILNENSRVITPSDVEVDLFSVEVLMRLAEVQERRLENKDKKGNALKAKIGKIKIGTIPIGRDASIIDISDEIINMLPRLRGVRDRLVLYQCYNTFLTK